MVRSSAFAGTAVRGLPPAWTAAPRTNRSATHRRACLLRTITESFRPRPLAGGLVCLPMEVVPAEGPYLEQILDTSFATWGEGLSRRGYERFNAAQRRTTWGARHLQRFA